MSQPAASSDAGPGTDAPERRRGDDRPFVVTLAGTGGLTLPRP